MATVPIGYTTVVGTGFPPSPQWPATLLGATDPTTMIGATVVMRRHASALLDPPDEMLSPVGAKDRPSDDDFAQMAGADQAEMDAVILFTQTQGLQVPFGHTGSRRIEITGTVQQMADAFCIDIVDYQFEHPSDGVMVFRSHGDISLPDEIQAFVVVVLGIGNQKRTVNTVTYTNVVPPNTVGLLPSTVQRLYGWNTATNPTSQTIGIVGVGTGYQLSDITSTLNGWGFAFPMPTITNVMVSGAVGGPDAETTLDICNAIVYGNGCKVVFCRDQINQNLYDTVSRLLHPRPGEPVCSILSQSSVFADETFEKVNFPGFWNAFEQVLQDCATLGVTYVNSSGDWGTTTSNTGPGGNYSVFGDGQSHPSYPSSNPFVLSVGGTVIGNVNGNLFQEWVWNDNGSAANGGQNDPQGYATGGGISTEHAVPGYQTVTLPVSNFTGRPGRGYPDIAGMASSTCGAPITLNGVVNAFPANGTSSSCPMVAGTLAVLNHILGFNVGFVNPAIYSKPTVHARDINPGAGAPDNSVAGVTGYPVRAGWDACTGLGVLNQTALLQSLIPHKASNFSRSFNVTAGAVPTVAPTGFNLNLIGTNQVALWWNATPPNASTDPVVYWLQYSFDNITYFLHDVRNFTNPTPTQANPYIMTRPSSTTTFTQGQLYYILVYTANPLGPTSEDQVFAQNPPVFSITPNP